MRKVTFGGAISLDHFIARTDHTYDWIISTKEANEILKDYWDTIDTIVMGRLTYEVAAAGGAGGGHAGIKTYVFSRTMKKPNTKRVTFLSEDAADFVRRLKKEEGKDICVMGGGLFAKSLFEADLIDEIGFNIHPVLLGSGIPLFHDMSRQIDLELKECRPLSKGCVYVSYDVKHK
jgi:dihydrofolate reductase